MKFSGLEVNTINDITELMKLANDDELHGLYHMPNQLYHDGPGINASILKEGLKSAADMEAAWNVKNSKKSKGMAFGSAFHSRVLHDPFDTDEYIKEPDELRGMNKAKNPHKKIWDSFKLENKGKNILSHHDHDMIMRGERNLLANSAAQQMLYTGNRRHELSMYWNDPDTDVLCKARADCLSEIHGLVDLKTTKGSCLWRGFKWNARDYSYWLQTGHYLNGIDALFPWSLPRKASWIVVENHGLNHCNVIPIGDTVKCQIRAKEMVELFHECSTGGVWPGPVDTIVEVNLDECIKEFEYGESEG